MEHEAYVTLMAARAGVRVSRVLAAGPAGPAKDALLVTRPPAGRLLSALTPYVPPPEATEGEDGNGDADAEDAATVRTGRHRPGRRRRCRRHGSAAPATAADVATDGTGRGSWPTWPPTRR